MNTLAADPDAVHELLAIAIVILLAANALLAALYLRVLGWFFEELKLREPDVWVHVGSPGVLDMMLLPLARFRKYYAFLPVLRERATRPHHAYQYAAPAFRLLAAGLATALVAFGLVGATAFWIVRHGL